MEVRQPPVSNFIVISYFLRSWDLHVTSSCHRIKIYSVNRSRPATAQRLKEIEDRGEEFEPLSKPLEWSLEGEEERFKISKRFPREPEN